jgi:hypothetical protein
MADQPCPVCTTPTTLLLHDTSNVWDVGYYRCSACEHFWTMSTKSGEILHHITSIDSSQRKWSEEYDPFDEAAQSDNGSRRTSRSSRPSPPGLRA